MKSNTVLIVVGIGCLVCCMLTLCLAGLGFGWWVIGNQAEPFEFELSPQTGRIAPDFQLETVDGENISLTDFRGTPVMINFWALWCGPCLEEMPLIQKRFRLHDPDLVVLAIEDGQDRWGLENYVDEAGLSFEVLLGSDELSRRYGILAYPTSFFIDTDGVIRSVVVGSMSASQLDAELNKIGVGD